MDKKSASLYKNQHSAPTHLCPHHNGRVKRLEVPLRCHVLVLDLQLNAVSTLCACEPERTREHKKKRMSLTTLGKNVTKKEHNPILYITL